MCIDRACYEGECERCRKIDRLCDWPYSFEPIYRKPAIRTAVQEDKWNKFMMIQIKKTEELGRKFYKGKQSGKDEFRRQNRETI